MNHEKLFPHLVRGMQSPDHPDVGHGLVVQLIEHLESKQGRVSPEQLQEAGLSPENARRIALENLARFADESPDLSVQVLGTPGGPIHLLLYADHPLASACLLLPDLYEHAAEMLHETELLACVPQAESLVVFPAAIREAVVAKLREIEADAARPLTFELFSLSANGVVPFTPAR